MFPLSAFDYFKWSGVKSGWKIKQFSGYQGLRLRLSTLPMLVLGSSSQKAMERGRL